MGMAGVSTACEVTQVGERDCLLLCGVCVLCERLVWRCLEEVGVKRSGIMGGANMWRRGGVTIREVGGGAME